MKTKIKIIIVTVIALTMIILGLVFAINTKKESVKNFQDGGYIISNVYKKNNNSEINKIYFDSNSKYTKHSNGEYSFNNSDGKKNTVAQDSFVHYNNNSIMALKDGVAIDLNNIDSKIISYYNIFSESILTKTSKGYEINNLNEVLTFQKLLFKISDKKYLMAADNIVISFSDSQTASLKNYVEIEYINENVIKLYNDESEYQTIASNLYLISDNIKINLEYKSISKNNIKYLTMADMVINANDNIEVLPKEELPTTPSNGNNTGNNQNTNQGNNQTNQGNNQNNGSTNGNILDQIGDLVNPDENVDSENSYIQPTFTVESMDVTSLGFENLKITLEDKSNILYGNRQVELIDNSTGTVIENFEDWEEGELLYTINYYTKLKPNREYTLNIKGQYKIDDTVYDRTFVSKIFRTLDIGLEITEDYVTSDTVSFAIYRNAYSKVKALSYEIVDSDDNVVEEETKATYDSNNNIVIATTSNKLKPNSNYKLKIKTIQYDSDEYSTSNVPNLSMSYKLKTLKQKPNIDKIKLQAILDNQKNTIQLSIDNLIDNNNGIKSITYNVYDTTGADENGELVQTIVQNDYKPITLSIDDLIQGQSYYFSVTIEFDDNEKTIIYTSNNSNIIGTSPIKYPSVVGFEKATDSGAERIHGILNIIDEEKYIYINNIRRFKIVIKENSGIGTYSTSFIIEQDKVLNSTEINLPVDFEGLKPNTEYILNVYLESTSKATYIGYETVKTSSPEPIYLVYKNLISDDVTDEIFGFKLNIDQEKDNINGEVSSSKNLGYMKLELQKCNKSDKCETLSNFSRTVPKTQNQSEEIESLKKYNAITLLASEFSYFNDNYDLLDDEYYKVSIKAISSKNYEIPINIRETNDTDFQETSSFKLNIIDNIPSLEIKVEDVPNSECDVNTICEKNENLDDDTIIGFNLNIKPIKSTKGELIKSLKYEIYESDKCEDEESIKGKTLISSDSYSEEILSNDNIKMFVNMTDKHLSRGKKYCLKYISTYTDEGIEKEGKKGYVSLFALKQAIQLKGYIKKYDGKNVIFNIESIDPDMSGQKLQVIANNSVKSESKILSGANNYEISTDGFKNFKLNILENRGQGDESETIYEDGLEEIVSLSNLNLVVSSSDGRIKIDLPFSTEYCKDFGESGTSTSSCKINENLENVNIYGLKFGANKYIKFTKYETYYGVEILSRDFDNYNISVLENNKNKVLIPDFSVIYDSGKINSDNFDTLFIKRANSEDENSYLYSSKGDFSNIYSTNIYSTSGGTGKYKSDAGEIEVLLNMYKSSDSDKKWIGQRYNDILIHANEAAMASSTVYDYEFNKKSKNADGNYELDYNNVMELVNQEIKYRTNGAKIIFEISNDNLDKISDLKFNLLNSDKNEILLVNMSDSANPIITKGDGITEDVSVSATRNATTTEYIVDLTLKRANNYYYSLSYKNNGVEEYFYYSRKLQNIQISTIQSLTINDRNASYSTKYWSFDDNKKLKFIKNLNYSFKVSSNSYELLDDEKLVYYVYLRNDSNEEYLIKNLQQDDGYFEISTPNDDKISLNSKTLNIATKAENEDGSISKIEGNFIVIIKPFVISKDDTIELGEYILNPLKPFKISNNSPKIGISNNLTKVKLSVDDSDGVLEPCEGYSVPSGVTDLKTYFPTSTLDPDPYVYYFKIFELDTDGDSSTENIIGYAPVGFNIKTAELDFGKFFTKNGNYRYAIDYCSINGKKTEYKDIVINSISDLNLEILPPIGRYYILKMANPNPETKSKIEIIDYTVTYTKGEPYSYTYSNVDLDQENNFSFTSDNESNFLTLLKFEERNGSLPVSISVNIYSYDKDKQEKQLIAQVGR